MNDEAVTRICSARAAACKCGLADGHDGSHECGLAECRGMWTGSGPDFEPVRFPGFADGGWDGAPIQ